MLKPCQIQNVIKTSFLRVFSSSFSNKIKTKLKYYVELHLKYRRQLHKSIYVLIIFVLRQLVFVSIVSTVLLFVTKIFIHYYILFSFIHSFAFSIYTKCVKNLTWFCFFFFPAIVILSLLLNNHWVLIYPNLIMML